MDSNSPSLPSFSGISGLPNFSISNLSFLQSRSELPGSGDVLLKAFPWFSDDSSTNGSASDRVNTTSGVQIDFSNASAADMQMMFAAIDRANPKDASQSSAPPSQSSAPAAPSPAPSPAPAPAPVPIMQLTNVTPVHVLPNGGGFALKSGASQFGSLPMTQPQIWQTQLPSGGQGGVGHQAIMPSITILGGGSMPYSSNIGQQASFPGIAGLSHAPSIGQVPRVTPFMQAGRPSNNTAPLMMSQSISSQDQLMAQSMGSRPIQLSPQQLQALLSGQFQKMQQQSAIPGANLQQGTSGGNQQAAAAKPAKKGRGRANAQSRPEAAPSAAQAGGAAGSERTWKTKYTEISRLEDEVKSKQAVISQLQEESRQLLRKEKLLKLQVANSERTAMCYNNDPEKIPVISNTADFVSAWSKFMEEVTEVMLEITAHGHTGNAIRRLVDIDERIWDWTVNVCVHHPSTILEAQDLSMQTGEPYTMPLDFWAKVVAKLDLTEEQATDLIEVTRLCTGVLNGLASDQIAVLKELSSASEESVSLQWGDQACKGKFGSSAWSDRMEKQEEMIKKYQAVYRRNHMVNFMASFLMNRLLSPTQRVQLYFSSFPSFPRFKLIMAAVFMTRVIGTQQKPPS